MDIKKEPVSVTEVVDVTVSVKKDAGQAMAEM